MEEKDFLDQKRNQRFLMTDTAMVGICLCQLRLFSKLMPIRLTDAKYEALNWTRFRAPHSHLAEYGEGHTSKTKNFSRSDIDDRLWN